VETTLAEQVAIDELAFGREKTLGRPVVVASFAGPGTATVFDVRGARRRLRPVEGRARRAPRLALHAVEL
jgi:hypothetical protein